SLTFAREDVDDPATPDDDDLRDSDPTQDPTDPSQATLAFTSGGPGQHDHSLDAGVVPTQRLGNLVWYDVDNDGVADPTEDGIAGVTVELWRDDGDGVFDPAVDTLVSTQLTADGSDALEEGEYLFEFLPPGDYFVAIPDADLADGGVLDGLASSTGNDAGGVAPDPDDNADSDDNGDPSAYGVVSAAVTLSDDAEPTDETNPFSSAVDDGDGAGVGDGADSIDDADSNLTVDFGFYQPLRVGNLVFLDDGAGTAANRNDGVADPGEAGVAGVLVQLLADDGTTVLAETVTDANGNYYFDGLDAGDYRIGIPTDQTPYLDPGLAGSINPTAVAALVSSTGADATAGADDVDDGAGPADAGGDAAWASRTDAFTLAYDAAPDDEQGDFDGEGAANTDAEDAANAALADKDDTFSDLSIDLGFAPPNLYRVGNLVWLDADNDGLVDDGETPLEGVVVELTDPAGTVIDTTVTDASGNYEFDQLPAGEYRIQVPVDQTAGDPTALESYLPSTGAGVDADPDDATTGEDNDSNGSEVGATADAYVVRSGVFELGDATGTDPFEAAEPTDEVALIDGSSDDDDTGNGLTPPNDV
ncbi:MAG: SdrD B-like domain-containing protein, partial [Actinomycetota bacterium]